MIYDLLAPYFPFGIPPNETLATLAGHPNFQLAFHYFLYNAALFFIAFLWGAGFIGLLIKQDKTAQKNTSVHFSTFATMSIGAGFSLIIATLFLLFLLQSLKTTTIIPLFSALSATALVFLFISLKNIQSTIKPIKKVDVALFSLIIFALAAYQLSAAGNWKINDATSFHLPYAKYFLLNNGVASVNEYLIYPYHTFDFNLLYSLGMMIDSNMIYLQTLHSLFAAFTALAIYAFCISTGQRTTIAIAISVIFLCVLSVINYSRVAANVDCGSMFYVLTATFMLYLWIQQRSTWLLVLSAIFYGIAIGTKYLMCLFALPIGICILLTAGKNWRPLAIYIFCSAAWGLWWYIRNFYYTGNPVHPFATSIFGYHWWNDEDISSQYRIMFDERIPRDIKGFLLMPYYAIQNSVLTHQRAEFIICIIYFSTLLSFLVKKHLNYLLLFCWTWLVFWVYTAQDPRYLMPITPLILVHFGALLHEMINRFLPSLIQKIIIPVIFVIAVFYAYMFIRQELIIVYYSDISRPFEEIDESVRARDPRYELISRANQVFGKDEPVYEFELAMYRWFYNGALIGNVFGPHSYWRTINNSVHVDGRTGISAERLEKNLREKYGAKGVMILKPPHFPYDINEFDQQFILVFSNDVGAIYRFRDDTGQMQ